MSSEEEREIRLILEEIFHRYHYDFRSYSLASLRRRLSVACLQLNCPTLAELRGRLLFEHGLFGRLLQFLTVQVSDMFRDPSFFRHMREQIVPVLRTYPSLKIWIAGCSTGEEVYSFAILLREEGLLERTVLYATDINPDALRRAEAGIYPVDRVAVFSENHRAAGGKTSLAAYYAAAYDSVAFDRSLRRNVVFADHSLATDSVFAEVHVVSCRNVLIYFDHALQERALGLMKDALVRRGFLGLGSRETLQFSAQAETFGEVIAGERWYQKC
jgi:chemotaxis protein methyltransferase CheR